MPHTSKYLRIKPVLAIVFSSKSLLAHTYIQMCERGVYPLPHIRRGKHQTIFEFLDTHPFAQLEKWYWFDEITGRHEKIIFLSSKKPLTRADEWYPVTNLLCEWQLLRELGQSLNFQVRCAHA